MLLVLCNNLSSHIFLFQCYAMSAFREKSCLRLNVLCETTVQHIQILFCKYFAVLLR